MNVADRLAAAAAERPDAIAVVSMGQPRSSNHSLILPSSSETSRGEDARITFGHLNADADTLARGLIAMGIGPGKRIALLVKPSIEFVTLVFALLRTGATMVLVDAGLGRKNIVRCLASTEPDGFVAIPIGHAMRVLKRKHFPKAKLNVTVGRRWLWGGETLDSVRHLGADASSLPTSHFPIPTSSADPAAIVFTSGSTGPPKGVLYTHQTFVAQCDSIQRQYNLEPGGVDLACFPLFGLFNVACGITTVLPEMDFSRPASCDPKKVLAAANQWEVTQAFGSPAVWDRLSRHCEQTGGRIPTLRKVFSCGAPVPATVLKRTLACVHPEAEMHTPYGATESLPVATIEAQEILNETAAKTNEGAGVCVGRKFDGIQGFDWRIIRISDDPIASIDQTETMPTGEIGELIVRGPQVSTQYLTGQPEASAPGSKDHNAISKIRDGDTIWHRIGDVGYFDEQERFWYCGRKSQRVVTSEGTLYTECVEQRVNREPDIIRSALVGITRNERNIPVLIYEDFHPWEGDPEAYTQACDAIDSLGLANVIENVVRHMDPLPTDIRHNSKVRREELAVWAEERIRKQNR